MKTDAEMIVLGKINGFYGVKGWVKLFSHTQPRAQIIEYNPLYIRPGKKLAKTTGSETEWQPIKVINAREQGAHVLAHFEGMDTKEASEAFLGYEVAIKKDQLVNLDGDTYYWRDLIGLSVIDSNNGVIGQITQMLETGANDVMVIKPSDGGIVEDKNNDVLIPFTLDNHVIKVDLDNQTLTVDWDPNF